MDSNLVNDSFWDDTQEQPIDTMEVPEGQARSRPAGDGRYYHVLGRRYPRVTEILSCGSGGEGLQAYMGKTAALRAAAPLVHAGLYTPPMDDPFHAELERFVDGEAIRVLDADDAIRQACDWQRNMREGFRYRDHKGRIGSVTHMAMYEHAIGLWTPGAEDVAYLEGLAARAHLWSDELVARLEELGVSFQSAVTDLAHHALPYVRAGVEWQQAFQPEWLAIGLEACVVNTEHEYAGTLDGIATFDRDRWEKAGKSWPLPGQRKGTFLLDFKTSNSLSDSVRFQLAAYARASWVFTFADEQTHEIPAVDGLLACHIVPDQAVGLRHWIGHETIDRLFEAFTHLNGWYRARGKLPRATGSRAYTPPKKPKIGERKSPIMIGRAS